MTASQPNLFTREDTIFGVCEGIGQDFGFNAQYLRIALAGLIFWNPLAAIGSYAALGVAVLARACCSRPARRWPLSTRRCSLNLRR